MEKKKLVFKNGVTAKNRFMLAPMTNTQSHENGSLSDEDLHWLKMRAEGGFGIIMTCAAHVQEIGKGFPGQLGIFSDNLKEGHTQLTKQIKSYGSLALIQLHHAGMRSPKELINTQPVCPSDNEETGARALSTQEIEKLKNDFILAAIRAKDWGYDGVELHSAHGYILAQFLSSEINNRNDEYGGTIENRSKIIFDLVSAIREACGIDFLIGVRLSPERFGMDLSEIKIITQKLIDQGFLDYIDVSLWDVTKYPEDKSYQDKTLLEHFLEINYKEVKLTVAGKITSSNQVKNLLREGVDFVSIGRSAILHHDFPKQLEINSNFETIKTPVSEAYLKKQGLSRKFIDYMRKWPEFVEEK